MSQNKKFDCLNHDGLLVIDLSGVHSLDGQALEPSVGSIAFQTARSILDRERVHIIDGTWTDIDGNILWDWNGQANQDIMVELLNRVFLKKNLPDQFQGSLLITVPDEKNHHVADWLYNPYHNLIAKTQVNAIIDSDARTVLSWIPEQSAVASSTGGSAENLLGIDNLFNLVLQLWREVSQCGRAAIFCKPTHVSDKEQVKEPFFCPEIRCGLIEYFDERSPDPIAAYVRTFLSRIAYKVSPTVSEKAREYWLSASRNATLDWGEYSLQPKSIEYEDFFRQELGSRKLAGNFLEVCCNAFSCEPDQDKENFDLLPNEILVAMGALRIARRLANWTLEGESFCCSIALFEDQDHNNLVDFAPIIQIEPDVPFTFPYVGKIRKHAEAAQGEGLFMLVNASSGKLTKIIRHIEQGDELRHRRHDFFGNLVSRKGMVIHMRDQGFVEVYAQGKLAFWNDGFEWRTYPYKKLEKVLSKHLKQLSKTPKNSSSDQSNAGQPQTSGRPRHLDRVRDALIDAIRSLLDRQASSLIILLDDLDEIAFEEVAYEQMRQELVWAGDKVYVEKLDPDGLAGLLMVDGAHVINSQGMLIDLARRIDAPRPRYTITVPYDRNKHKDLRKGIKLTQRFEEFNVRRTENVTQQGSRESKTVLDVYGHIDERKWNKSLHSTLFLTENDDVWNQIQKQVCSDLRMAWLVEISDCEHKLPDQKTVDELVKELKSLFPYRESDLSLAQSRRPYCRILDPDSRMYGLLLPLFGDANRPIAFPFFVNEDIDPEFLKTAINFQHSKTWKVKLRTCYAVESKSSRPNTRTDPWNCDYMGFGFQTVSNADKNYWFALDNSIKIAAESRDIDLPQDVQQKFRALMKGDSDEDHAGTGTRAADELSKRLPNSTVIKVSSSGNVKFYPL